MSILFRCGLYSANIVLIVSHLLICKRLSVSQLGKCPVGFQPNKLQSLVQSLQHGLTVFRDDLTVLDHNVPQRRRRLLIVVQDDSPWVGIGLIGIYIIDIVLRRTLLYRLWYRTRFISASSNSWLGISICLFRFIAVCLSLERISARITDATLHAHL